MNNTEITVKQASSLNVNDFNLDLLKTRFLDLLQVKENTKKTYYKGIKNFIDYMIGKGINTPNRIDIINYLNDLQAQGLKPTTIKAYLSSVKALYKFLELNTDTIKDIAKGIKAPAISKEFKKDYLTPAQVKELVASADTLRDKIIILLGATCGLRTIEICRLNRNDLELKSDLSSNTIKPILWVLGKGRDEKEYIVIPKDLYNMIQEYLSTRYDRNDALIISNKGRFIPNSISRIIKQALRGIGINSDKFTAHSLRHTAITLSLIAGNDIRQVQELSRHKNLNTVLIYAQDLKRINNNCSSSVMNLIK